MSLRFRGSLLACPLLLAGLAAAQTLTPIDEHSYPGMLAAHKGKVLVVDFWATWCVPCRVEMPQLAALANQYRSRGLILVTVSADEPEAERQALEFLRQSGIGAPAYIKRARNDDKFINAVDPKWSGALPGLFLYDRHGRKVQSFIGETDMKALDTALRRLLSQ